jgi:hypothetical protein
MKQFKFRLLTSALLLTLAQTGQAALNAVDPGPYTADYGFFPMWYQDTQATALDLCLSLTESSRVPGVPGAPSYMCTILPNPGIFDDTLPMVFPTNWPDEAFWFSAGAAIDDTTVDGNAAGDVCVSYGAHVEAAFGGGVPAANDQVSFARIRVRANVPATGTYIITHPYGVETSVATTATPGRGCNGNNTDISITRDIGIGAPGDFTGALTGDVGPFLRTLPGIDPTQNADGTFTETNPVTGLPENFIGDPNLTTPVIIGGVLTAVPGTPVIGGPFGNILRIQGPVGLPPAQQVDFFTDLFALSGKVFPQTLPTPLEIVRTDYSRSLSGLSQIDVFANSASTASLIFTDVALNTTVMADLNGDSEFFGMDAVNAPVPGSLIDVTASNSAIDPSNFDTTLSSTLVDLVTISSATYSLSTGMLTVVAASSDETGAPTLTLVETGATGSGAAGVTFPPAGPLPIPPATVTVTSANSGSDTEAVVLVP